MSTDIVLSSDLPDFLPATGISELTKQLAGHSGVKRIVPKNGIFRKVVGSEEMGKVKGTLNVIVVNASPKVGRIFYSKPWSPDSEPTAPDCFSNDGAAPDPKAENPQASRCDSCPKNIKGSGQGSSKACRYSRRLAMLLEEDFGTALEGEVYQINLASKSLFGDGGDNLFTFENYTKYLSNNGKSLDWIVTEISFNENNDNQSVLFSPVRFITKPEYAVVTKAAQRNEVKTMVVMTPYQADVSGRKQIEAPKAEAAAEDKVDEPVKREAAAKPTPPAKKNLDDVVKAWSDEE